MRALGDLRALAGGAAARGEGLLALLAPGSADANVLGGAIVSNANAQLVPDCSHHFSHHFEEPSGTVRSRPETLTP